MKKNSSRHGLEVSVEIVIPMKKGIKIKNNKKYCEFIKIT